MRKTPFQILLILFISIFIFSCNSGNKEEKGQEDTTQEDATGLPESDSENKTIENSTQSFDINKIPISEKELGDFPFFSIPEGCALLNRKPLERKFDKLFFPLDGIMTPVEGRSWKAYIGKDKNEEWSLPYFEKSYDEAITAVGGVKVFDGKVSSEELSRIKDEATYFGEEGSIDYWNDQTNVYVIRRPNGNDVYIQFSGNSASGSLQILQKEAFKQTITMLKSDEIQKQLNEKGKAVLNINFDTDKASLKPDGSDAVKEIIKVLQSDQNLRIAINGYTDNSGSADHNQKLSEARAETVKNEIIKAGIDTDRLTSKGFGQESPIADNSTEEGKSQNRRVELVKQ